MAAQTRTSENRGTHGRESTVIESTNLPQPSAPNSIPPAELDLWKQLVQAKLPADLSEPKDLQPQNEQA
jgi:hypothetical protein